MIEKIDMDKLQKLVYYINNVKMSGSQRERLNGVIIGGILRGELNTDEFSSSREEVSSIQQFLESDVMLGEDILGQWVQANSFYEKYDCWCNANGIKAESLTAFGRYLKDTGVEFKKKSDGNYYRIEENSVMPE